MVHLPSSAIALLFVPAACLTLLCLERERIEVKRHTAIMLAITSIYIILVVQSVSSDQISFFWHYSEWMENEKHYFSAKLLKFSVSLVPALIVGLCIALVRHREGALRGLFVAVVAVAIVAVLNVTRYAGTLFATDYETAAFFFANVYEAELPSVVSYGFLFCIAFIASMTMKRLWFLGGVFIFMIFLLGRRTELALSLVSLFGFWLWHFYKNGESISLYTRKVAVVVLTAATLSVILSNEISVQRWSGLWDSVKERIDILLVATEQDSGAAASRSVDPSAAADRGAKSTTEGGSNPIADEKPVPSPRKALSDALLFGYGLGWYSELGSVNDYPHNALVESWFESGAIAAFVLASIYAYSVALSFKAATRWQSGLAIFLMIACLVTASMKSGDIASSARLFSFLLISTSFGRALQPSRRNATSS